MTRPELAELRGSELATPEVVVRPGLAVPEPGAPRLRLAGEQFHGPDLPTRPKTPEQGDWGDQGPPSVRTSPEGVRHLLTDEELEMLLAGEDEPHQPDSP